MKKLSEFRGFLLSVFLQHYICAVFNFLCCSHFIFFTNWAECIAILCLCLLTVSFVFYNGIHLVTMSTIVGVCDKWVWNFWYFTLIECANRKNMLSSNIMVNCLKLIFLLIMHHSSRGKQYFQSWKAITDPYLHYLDSEKHHCHLSSSFKF